MEERVVISPMGSLTGTVRAPGDKSISHRALLLSALADGVSTITGLSAGHDVRGTAIIISQLGATIDSTDGGIIEIRGAGEHLGPSNSFLDCGNSGTTIRLVMGICAGIPGHHRLLGDPSLSRRPMDRVAIPLRLMGADIDGQGTRCTPPIEIEGSRLTGIDYLLPMASAQVKSAILLAGLLADGPTTVREAIPTRIHTEEMLLAAGVDIEVHTDASETQITVRPSRPRPSKWVIPADPSQAAFFVVAGLLGSQSAVDCTGLYPGPNRSGFLDVLDRMGASITRNSDADGLLNVLARSTDLEGTEIAASEIPSLDEVPILAIAAAAADGTTRFADVGELRVKESDRLMETVTLVNGLGAGARVVGDDLIIEGLGSPKAFAHVTSDAHGDHRMAMSAAIAGAVGGGASIHGFESVATSYPGFLETLRSLG